MPGGYGVFTSNVDGQFQRAGFDPERVVECHGAIDHNQCLLICDSGIYPAGPEEVDIDLVTMEAAEPLPTCPTCGGVARPNILMFGDHGWLSSRSASQQFRMQAWLDQLGDTRIAVVECGAGTAIPSVRSFARNIADMQGTLIRINPREPQVPVQHVGLAVGALEAIRALDAAIA
jgi:NAD-dependent SIR2 family protein deacetylase